MLKIDDLPTPSLLLDFDVLERNLDHMAARARHLCVALRPHIKTHKCIEIGRLQRDRGAVGLTVSTLEEAKAFADAGFDDLTWAFPVILNRLAEARSLAARVTLRLVVDSAAAIDALEGIGHPFHVWLKVDCGYHRAGVDPHAPLAHELAQRLAASPGLLFDGILSHSGHAYAGHQGAAVRAAAAERRVMAALAAQLRTAGIVVPAVSVGSTPAMAVVDHLAGVDEARPGNYVFYDGTQVALGSCTVADCALTVLASVVSAQPGARHSVIDAGALALSKDPGPTSRRSLGTVLGAAPGCLRRGMRLTSLSQEHGIVSLAPTAARLAVGERLRVLPNHSCLTAACFDSYAVVRGTEVVDRWRIWRQR